MAENNIPPMISNSSSSENNIQPAIPNNTPSKTDEPISLNIESEVKADSFDREKKSKIETDIQAKEKVINEFREKLLNEQEIKKELQKNVTLTNEDLDSLKKGEKPNVTLKDVVEALKPTTDEKLIKENQNKIKKEQERLKKEEEKLKKEANRLKKEEERIKKEEEKLKLEKSKNKQETEEQKQKREKEEEKLKKDKENLEESKKKLEKNSDLITRIKTSILSLGGKITSSNNNRIDITTTTTQKQQKNKKTGVLMKDFNITDTGISKEFLYTEEYKKLISNKTNITKVDTNKESDIPIIGVTEKNIINFQTSDIPPEILSYKRTEENKHIPTVILAEDLQAIAKKAIAENNLSVLRGIIEQTKDPDFLVSKNSTMLSYAIEYQRYIIVRYLLYSGASINRVDDKLNTPLHISIINRNLEIAELLINNGIDIDAQNIDGNTPLMLAIATNQDTMALILLKNGAKLKIKNKNGETAMSLCDKNKKYKIKQYIRDIIREEDLKEEENDDQ